MNSQNKPLRRQPQQKRGQERVERILDAAAIVFDEVGFEAATTHAIAVRANTAVGSLYQFFPDKLAIFNALELRHIDRVYAIWEQLLRPEVVWLPFDDFIHTMAAQFQQLFEQPTSRIIFVQFFTSSAIFKNIDRGFTQEAIQFTANLFKKRNPALTDRRSQLLGEICVHGYNSLALIALRSEIERRREIFQEIEAFLKTYLKKDIGDEAVNNNFSVNLPEKFTNLYKLNARQQLIINYVKGDREITIENCEAMFPDMSRRTLQRDLKAMLEQKLLLSEGNTNQRRYYLNRDFTNLRQVMTKASESA